MSGIRDVALVVFVRKRLPEIQYLKATITEAQQGEFGELVASAVSQIEAGQFPPHNGIRFPTNGCTTCTHLGLCLGNQTLITAQLRRQPTNGHLPMPPKLNRRRAMFVLAKIDDILAWEHGTKQERDSKFVELGRYLCEVRAGQYWRLDNLSSFDQFLEKKFQESRRKAYYLMAIHERLPRIPKKDLREVGWTKATELAKLARREGQRFESAIWLHKARSMPSGDFKREVEKQLTGKETEPWELLYFKVYKSQLQVIEQALETASRMLGTEKSRGYILEMICADFLAGANLETENSDSLITALSRLVEFLPQPKRLEFADKIRLSA
jgi:hypothetical protein